MSGSNTKRAALDAVGKRLNILGVALVVREEVQTKVRSSTFRVVVSRQTRQNSPLSILHSPSLQR